MLLRKRAGASVGISCSNLPPADTPRATSAPALTRGRGVYFKIGGRDHSRAGGTAFEAAPHEDGDEERDAEHDGDDDADPLDVVGHLFGSAEVVAETDHDSNFHDPYRGVDGEELRRGELRSSDGEVHGSP